MQDEIQAKQVIPAQASAQLAHADQAKAGHMEAFTFGDPMPVMDGRGILDYIECWMNGRWYEPPISLDGLAKTFRASTHHSSALFFKRNVLASTFIQHKWLDRDTFGDRSDLG